MYRQNYTTSRESLPMEDILKLKEEVEESGLKIEGIESVNIYDSIKIGLPERKLYIDFRKLR